MSELIAARDHTRKGGWSVPVGSIIKDELRACDHCGQDVNVITVRTATGTEVMADDIDERADADETVCSDCLPALLGSDE